MIQGLREFRGFQRWWSSCLLGKLTHWHADDTWVFMCAISRTSKRCFRKVNWQGFGSLADVPPVRPWPTVSPPKEVRRWCGCTTALPSQLVVMPKNTFAVVYRPETLLGHPGDRGYEYSSTVACQCVRNRQSGWLTTSRPRFARFFTTQVRSAILSSPDDEWVLSQTQQIRYDIFAEDGTCTQHCSVRNIASKMNSSLKQN